MKDLKKFIREYIENSSLIAESVTWTDKGGDPVAQELYDLLLDRWGAGGISYTKSESSRQSDSELVGIIETSFPDIKTQSIKNLQGATLYRGVRILDKEQKETITQDGLQPRGGLCSWSTDLRIARGFAAGGLLLRVPSSVAAQHIVVDFETYFSAFPDYEPDSYELGESEVLLQDFFVEPQYIKKMQLN